MSEDIAKEVLRCTVSAKLSAENGNRCLAAALGNPKEKVCKVYREQAISHFSKSIELLNVDKQSVKVIALRSLLKFDLLRSVGELKEADRIALLLNNEWLKCYNQLDPLSPFTVNTASACILAWSKGMDLLNPFIGAKGVEKQKKRIDSRLSPVKKKVAKKKTIKRKKR